MISPPCQANKDEFWDTKIGTDVKVKANVLVVELNTAPSNQWVPFTIRSASSTYCAEFLQRVVNHNRAIYETSVSYTP